jgi:hypothetical protein
MLIDRRTFVVATGFIAAVPFAGVLAPPSAARAHPLPAPDDATTVDLPEFGIAGWRLPGDTSGEVGDLVWISINRSWRTAWR